MKQTLSPPYLFHGVRATATLLLVIAWLSPSGNLYAQTESDTLKSTKFYIDLKNRELITEREEKSSNEADTLKPAMFYMDPATGELKPLEGEINPDWLLYDTIPRFNNRIIDIGFGFAFPLRDFHASDPSNESSGYALPGYSVSTGLFFGFAEGSEAGWYLGASYSGFRKSMDFVDSLNSAMPVITLNEGEENETQESRNVEPDYRPRYDIFSLRTGFAFEGSDERISAYGSLLISVNFMRMNSFDLINPTLEDLEIRSPLSTSTGFSAAFGLRFQQQLSLGVAYHYIGAPTLAFSVGDSSPSRSDTFYGLPMQRRIHFPEIKMGYSFVKRGGWRAPKVKAIN